MFQQMIQNTRSKLPRKQITQISALIVIHASHPLIKDHLIEEPIVHHIGHSERRRVGPAPRPVDPRQRPIRQQMWRLDAKHGRKVVLVHIAVRFAKPRELGVIFLVSDDVYCQFPVHLEPLRPFSPLGNVDLR